MRLTRHAEIALTEAYTPQGINIGINLGRPAGAGVARSSARASRAALERRHQLHDRDRRHARAAGRPDAIGGEAAADLRTPRRVEPRRTRDRREKMSARPRAPGSYTMILELTAEQKAFQQQIEQFAREIVAQRAAGIDKSGEFPADVMHAAAGQGLLGVTIPKAWGGLGKDYVSYALAIETIARASATVAVSLSVTNSLVAEVIAHAGRDAQRERWLRPAGDRRGDRRLRAVGAGRRHRRRQSADQSGERGRRLHDHRQESLGRQRGRRRGRDRLRAHASRPARPGYHRVPGADGHRRDQANRARRFARRARPRLHGSRARSHGRRRSGARPRRSGIRAGDVGAAGRPRRDCGAGARHRPGGARRGDRLRQAARSSSASRSPTIRRFSGCSPTWRPNSPRRGC